ncbi:MAG: DNAase, partial [Betaproteobacteria bacterium]|nr:DNAase [Betaproteobacteria bacterium]
ISRLKDISVENVANVTTTNFFDLFSKCKQSQC